MPDRSSSRHTDPATAKRMGRASFGGGSDGSGSGVGSGSGFSATPMRTVWLSVLTSTVVLSGEKVSLAGTGASSDRSAGISATTK